MYVSTERLPVEQFEQFANELVSNLFRKKIYTFAQGPDGGIDGVDDSQTPSIIVQSKRYQFRTSSSSLKDKVLKELKKIKTLATKNEWEDFQYIIVTSGNLTPSAKKAIRDAAGKMMTSDQNILTEIELGELASNTELAPIYRKYNLIPGNLIEQLQSLEQQSIDTETTASFSDFDVQYVAQTGALELAYRTLVAERMVMITGNPGVGKSTTCRLLELMFYSRKDAKFSIITRGIDEIQSVIDLYTHNFRKNSSNLVVLFDDFLGRNTVEATDSQINRIIKLISISKTLENLYIILNSRTQILKDAGIRNLLLQNYTDNINFEKKNIVIDLDELTDIEKAKILRLNIMRMFDKLDDSDKKSLANLYETIRKSKNYLSIIHHKNFNPRLIEQISMQWRLAKQKGNYFDFIKNVLNNPRKIYDELFDKLLPEEKYYLLLLFLFGDLSHPGVSSEALKRAYDALELLTTNDSRQTADLLIGSWTKSYLKGNKNINFIGFSNPSITDYLRTKIQGLSTMVHLIEQHAVYLTQLRHDRPYFEQMIATKFDFYLDQNNYLIDRLIYVISQEPSEPLVTEFQRLVDQLANNKPMLITDSIVSTDWLRLINNLEYQRFPQYCFHFFNILLHHSGSVDLIDSIISEAYDIDEYNRLLEQLNNLSIDLLGVTFEKIPEFSSVPDLTLDGLKKSLRDKKIELLQQMLDEEIADNIDVDGYSVPEHGVDDDFIDEVVQREIDNAYAELEPHILNDPFEKEIDMRDFDFDIVSDAVERQIQWHYIDKVDDEYGEWQDRVNGSKATSESVDDILDKPL